MRADNLVEKRAVLFVEKEIEFMAGEPRIEVALLLRCQIGPTRNESEFGQFGVAIERTQQSEH